jgi:ankyrin repeat protein
MNISKRILGAALLVFGFAATLPAQDSQAKLWDAAIAGDTAGIRSAIAAGAVIDSLDVRTSKNGRRPLNWAALSNKPEAVKLLIALKAPLQAVNLTGFTALHHAAEVGALESARVLLEAGADATQQNNAGETPADVAISRGFLELGLILKGTAPPKK